MKDTNTDDRSSGTSANCCGSQQTSAPTSGAEPPTLDELHDRWGRFVERVRGERISVGSLLSEGRPIVVSEGVIWILVPQPLHRDSLRDRRSFLAARASDTWGDGIESVKVVAREDFTEHDPTGPGPASGEDAGREGDLAVNSRPSEEDGSTVEYDDLFGPPALVGSTDESSTDEPPPPEGCLSGAERELYEAAFEVARERPDELFAVLEVVHEGLRCGKEAAQRRGGRYE